MILKAGTYRFNDDIDFLDSPQEGYAYQLDIDFTVKIDVSMVDYHGIATADQMIFRNITSNGEIVVREFYYRFISTTPDTEYFESDIYGVFNSNNGWTTSYGETDFRNFTLSGDQEVDDVIGNFIITHSNYNEVNGLISTPLAEITYNGETIAQLNAGETATLKCGPTEDTKYVMASDVVVKTSKIDYEAASLDNLPADVPVGSTAIITKPTDKLRLRFCNWNIAPSVKYTSTMYALYLWEHEGKMYYNDGDGISLVLNDNNIWEHKEWNYTEFSGGYMWEYNGKKYFPAYLEDGETSVLYTLNDGIWEETNDITISDELLSEDFMMEWWSFRGFDMWRYKNNLCMFINNTYVAMLIDNVWELRELSGLEEYDYGVDYIWNYNGNTYYSNSEIQKQLIDSEWVDVVWEGYAPEDARYIWTDGINTYYSKNEAQYILNGNVWSETEWFPITRAGIGAGRSKTVAGNTYIFFNAYMFVVVNESKFLCKKTDAGWVEIGSIDTTISLNS